MPGFLCTLKPTNLKNVKRIFFKKPSDTQELNFLVSYRTLITTAAIQLVVEMLKSVHDYMTHCKLSVLTYEAL